MQDLKLVLSKYIVRRRLEGGEFTYVYRPSNQSVAGKKAALALLKGDASAFDKLREESEVTEAGEELESQLLKIIPQLPFEDAVKEEDMETEENDGEDEFGSNEPVPLLELKRTVNVRMFNPGPQTVDEKTKECESFLRGSDDSIVFKRLGYDNKGKKKQKALHFRLTFSTEAEAQKFCAKEHTFKEKKVFPRIVLQARHRQRIKQLTTFATKITNVKVIVGLEKNQKSLGNYVFANCKNAEDIFKDATSIKSMVNSKNVALNHRNLESYLVEFPDANSAETAVESLNGKDVSVICVKDFKDNLELAEKENNLGELGNEPERKIVIIHPMDAGVIGNMFPSAASITKVKQNGLTVVEFKNANEAKSADAETVGLNCMSVVMMEKYFELRKSVFNEATYIRKIKLIKDALEKGDVKVEIEEDKIVIEGEERNTPNQTKKEDQKKEVQVKDNVKGKKAMKNMQTQTKIDNKLVSKRRYQVGQSDWDPFVVCTNFVPKDKSLGTPNEDDICKYFIHNHKNVVDVKFPRWNEKSAFVKFSSKDAADSFLELDYVMFFSTELGRNIMGQYLKNKTHEQKNEVSMMLLDKPYVFGTVVEEGNPFHVEFSGLQSQNDVLRSLFVNKLNLAEKDVGKITWDTAGEVKARINVKVPEAAVNHLIGRWNSMSVSVGGHVVSAEFWVPKGTKRHGDLLSKKQRKKNKQEPGPMALHY